jgi:ABC-type transport system involved in Fe-S cluster assembly fused permease/ATPase subunit
LSLAYHTRRKTGEVLRILDRGSAINSVCSNIWVFYDLMKLNLFIVLSDVRLSYGIIFLFAAELRFRLLFQILPIFIDIGVAIIYFAGMWISHLDDHFAYLTDCARDTVTFGPTLAILLAFVMTSYVVCSVKLTQVRVKLRREMNDKDKVSPARVSSSDLQTAH